MQLAADYWAFLYLVWVVPLLSASLLAQPDLAAPATESIIQPISQRPPARALAGDLPR